MRENIEICIDVNNRLVLSNFLDYSHDTYTFDISLSTNQLSYISGMCVTNLKSNILDLEEMDTHLKGSTILKEEFMESYIKLEMITLGHVLIEVFIVEVDSRNEIKVFFQADQTILKHMSNVLKNIPSY